MKLIIEDDEGHKTTVPFVRDELTVGREEGNTIRLTERNISRKHARFFREEGAVFIEDLESSNGVKVNGDAIQGQASLKDGDLVQIGDYDLAVQVEASTASSRAVTTSSPALPAAPADLERDPSKPAVAARGRDATSIIRAVGSTPSAGPGKAEEGVDIPPEKAPHLVVVSTELAGREFACIRTVLTLGRGDECDVAIDHRSLSRVHCKLERGADGAWRVQDLGSANKVQVNGEEYAESALASGDILSLGHVKLRWVAPGEDYAFVPEGAARKKPLGLIIGAALGGVVVLGGGLFLLLGHHKPSTPVLPDNPKTAGHSAGQPLIVTANEPVKAAEPKAVQPKSAEPKVKDEVAIADPSDAAAQKLIASATAAMAKKNFESARSSLIKAKGLGGDVDDALAHANRELKAQAALRDAMSKSDLEQAAELLREIPDDSAYAKEAKEKLDRIEAKLAKAHPKEPHKPVKVAAAAVTAPPKGEPVAEQDPAKIALELRQQAEGLIKTNSRFDEALSMLRKAERLTPYDPQVHRSTAICLVHLRRLDESEAEYRRFLALDPTHPEAPKIAQILQQYEDSKKSGQ